MDAGQSYAQKRTLLEEIADANHDNHCGTEAAMVIARQRIKAGKPLSILDAPVMQDSIISKSGKFMIHYDHTGKNAATNEYVTAAAFNADEAALLEIDTLGYPKPPYTFADSMWHIYLMEQGNGVYGFTISVNQPFGYSPSGLPKYRSFIVIDRDFSEEVYSTKGIDAARLTIFHEFHHLIQYGDYGNGQLTRDVSFREMTSVWLEMRSTPWIPDYLQYLPKYLDNLNLIFDRADQYNGYGQGIWIRFLAKRFDDRIIRSIWEWYSTVKPDFLLAFDSVLATKQSSFCNEYKRFGAMLMQSGNRYRGNGFLPDLEKYTTNHMPVSILSNGAEITMAINPASMALFQCASGGRTHTFVLTRNTDISEAPDAIVGFQDSTFHFSSNFLPTYCDTSFSFPNVESKVFPQPFLISGNNEKLNILASDKPYRPISSYVNIYSVDNTLVRHIENPSAYGGNWFHVWDGRDDIGVLVASGVYYYSVTTDGERAVGKLILVRSK